jgi:hypothetical protein
MTPLGATPSNNVSVPCPAGFYCGVGTSNPVSCPPGRFSSSTGLVNPGNCTLCSAGSYCASAGLTAPTGLCSAGYYCMRGNIDPAPTSGTSSAVVVTSGGSVTVTLGGDVCPVGFTCGNGTSTPVPCAPGTYSSDLGRSTACLPCPAGYFCVSGSSTFSRCVSHSYALPLASHHPLLLLLILFRLFIGVQLPCPQCCVCRRRVLSAGNLVAVTVPLSSRHLLGCNWTAECV